MRSAPPAFPFAPAPHPEDGAVGGSTRVRSERLRPARKSSPTSFRPLARFHEMASSPFRSVPGEAGKPFFRFARTIPNPGGFAGIANAGECAEMREQPRPGRSIATRFCSSFRHHPRLRRERLRHPGFSPFCRGRVYPARRRRAKKQGRMVCDPCTRMVALRRSPNAAKTIKCRTRRTGCNPSFFGPVENPVSGSAAWRFTKDRRVRFHEKEKNPQKFRRFPHVCPKIPY